jgi:hypothetical protein
MASKKSTATVHFLNDYAELEKKLDTLRTKKNEMDSIHFRWNRDVADFDKKTMKQNPHPEVPKPKFGDGVSIPELRKTHINGKLAIQEHGVFPKASFTLALDRDELLKQIKEQYTQLLTMLPKPKECDCDDCCDDWEDDLEDDWEDDWDGWEDDHHEPKETKCPLCLCICTTQKPQAHAPYMDEDGFLHHPYPYGCPDCYWAEQDFKINLSSCATFRRQHLGKKCPDCGEEVKDCLMPKEQKQKYLNPFW